MKKILLLLLLGIFFSAGQSMAQTVYVAKTGKSYHKKGCSKLSGSTGITLEKAKKEGYEPCKSCEPPTEVVSKQGTGSQQKGKGIQCSAKTQDGKRCTRTTESPSGKCFQHESK